MSVVCEPPDRSTDAIPGHEQLSPSRSDVRRDLAHPCEARRKLAGSLPADGELHGVQASATGDALRAQALEPFDAAFVAVRLASCPGGSMLPPGRETVDATLRRLRRRARRPDPLVVRSFRVGADPDQSSSRMRVATRSRKARSWVTTIAAGCFRRVLSSCVMPSMSRWLVGSSSRSRSGSRAKARARAARLTWPPDAASGARSSSREKRCRNSPSLASARQRSRSSWMAGM